MSPIDTAPIDAAAARSELIARALAKAPQAHAGQIRNGSGGLPYIEHPRMVAATLAARDYADTTLAAALLHDVVEDSDTTVEELRAEFGDTVADLVAALSDDESIEPYRERKDEHRAPRRRGRRRCPGDLRRRQADQHDDPARGDRGRRHAGSPTSTTCRSP